MESGWLGALLESPDLNHFHFLPQNHVNTVNVHALVDLIMPHYRKVHHKVFLTENKKEKHDHPLVWFYFLNPRTNIATP